jgi:arsenate reductase-like glutaredoxin family protein
MTITIFHNPACSTSRKVLDMIRASGEEPRIVEYLKHLPSRDELTTMLRDMQLRRMASNCAARPKRWRRCFSPSDLSGARCV